MCTKTFPGSFAKNINRNVCYLNLKDTYMRLCSGNIGPRPANIGLHYICFVVKMKISQMQSLELIWR